MNTAPVQEGTTLYISELSSGFLFTLSIRDVGYGDHEKHVWKTSYPMLDLLHPHWVGKQPINTPLDFLSQSLQRAEQSFGWKFLSNTKQFRFPEVAFGDGLMKVVCVQERNTQKILNQFAKDRYIDVFDRSTANIGEIIASKAAVHTEPFVVVIANFFSLEVVECTPRSIGSFVRWEYKVSRLLYEDTQQFVNHVATKKYLPFVAEHVPENILFNTIMNYTYWRPISTSSVLVKDIWRAFLTSALSEVGAHTSIHTQQNGIVYVTGELPVFLNDEASIQLAVVDGLALAGTWKIVVDAHYQLIPNLLDNANKHPFSDISEEVCSLWIIPQSKSNSFTTELLAKGTWLQAIHGNMYTFGSLDKIHDFKIRENGHESVITVPDWLRVKRITVDKRAWPVTYGPNTMANSVKIPQWLSRVRNIIQSI